MRIAIWAILALIRILFFFLSLQKIKISTDKRRILSLKMGVYVSF